MVETNREFTGRSLGLWQKAAINLIALEQVVESAPDSRTLRDLGDWTWLRAFDDDDLREFIAEMREALLIAGHEESSATIEDTLYRWQVTAQELADPQRRRILLGLEDVRDEDFVDVARPE